MKYMKLLLMADLHGHLPSAIPTGTYDVIVVAGDVLPLRMSPNPCRTPHLLEQADWLQRVFYPYLKSLPATHVVCCWGNHDWIGEHAAMVPTPPAGIHILTDRGCTIDGVTFYGLPWTETFCNWAFNGDATTMALQCARIPAGTHVLVSHGPPFGTGDALGAKRLGSVELARRIDEIQPRLVVCGHIHDGAGEYRTGSTDVFNVSVRDEQYRVVRQPRVYELKVGDA